MIDDGRHRLDEGDGTKPDAALGALADGTKPDAALGALADGTRRAILARLAQGERAVGDLARGLPVTRPAVSQHLKVLRAAGLVGERTEGTRHVYRLEAGGLAVLRRYVEELWGDTLDRFAAAAEAERRKGGDMQELRIDPVVKTIMVPLTPERAFALFFEEMASWWPLGTHSVYGADAVTVRVDGREGGRIYERTAAGAESDWGELLAWEPPARALFTWHPGYGDDAATEVEIRFTAAGELTRVELEHRDWENLGDRGASTRAGYDTGWNRVFGELYGGAALRG
jgi:DNA-binding transcriptional ArsR family regulator